MLCLRSIPVVVLVVLIALAAPLHAETVQFRGPSGPESGTLPEGEFGLAVAWNRSLGSGYSNVWIEGQKAVTMYAADGSDWLAALDLASGETLWRYELGPTYEGHDGSDDGPISNPTLAKGTIYALGPSGQLVAVDLASGAEKWRRQLDEDSSTEPVYGYATSPLVLGDQVIVATGGEGHAVTAFDRATGEPRWTVGDDAVSYQTPMVLELGGRQQLIVVTNYFLQGLDPASGEILWQLRHTEGQEPDEAAHPTAVDGERFLVKYNRGSRLYRWTGEGVEELWQSRAFGNTLALPVLVDDHFYGFTGNILTCASLETGEIVWRSRQAAALGLTAVDGRLAMVSRDGELVLVEASPEGYKELTRVPVLEAGNYPIPSHSGDLFLIRNLTHLAAIRPDTSLAPQVAEIDESDRLQGAFGRWVASLEALEIEKRQVAVESYFEEVAATPILGEDNLAHLVWRGAAEDVGVQGSFLPPGEELGLYSVEGTDLFFRTVRIEPEAHYTYNFTVDYGDPSPDPSNPYSVDFGFFVGSEMRTPGWPAAPHLEEPGEEVARGTLDRFPFRSDILDNTREIRVWRPAGYGQDPEKRYPLLVVNHGDNFLRGGLMQNTLDNLVGTSVAPLVAVFVPRVTPPEYGGPAADDYNRFLIEELIPHLDHHYLTDGKRRAIMGPGSAGVSAVYAALTHPEIFQMAAAQSFYPIEPAEERIPELLAKEGARPELVYVVWSPRDYDLGDGRTAEAASQTLRDQLQQAGVGVRAQIANYTPDWGGWRGQYDEILAAFFPLPAPE